MTAASEPLFRSKTSREILTGVENPRRRSFAASAARLSASAVCRALCLDASRTRSSASRRRCHATSTTASVVLQSELLLALCK